MYQVNLVDISFIVFYVLTSYLIIKRGWFYSYYQFFHFLVVLFLSFLISKYCLHLKPDSWKISNLHFYLLIQILSFTALAYLIRFRKAFIFLNRQTLNLDQFIFYHHLNVYLNFIPSLIVSFFITFCLYTILYSFNGIPPYYRQQIEGSYSNEVASKIYFASSGFSDRQLFGDIIFKITAAVNTDTPAETDSLEQSVILKQQEIINEQRTRKGLNEVGMGVYYPEEYTQRQGPAGSVDMQVSAIPEATVTPAWTPLPSEEIPVYREPSADPTPTPLPTYDSQERPSPNISSMPRKTGSPVPTSRPAQTLTSTPTPTPLPTKTPKPTPLPVNIEETERKVFALINQIRADHGAGELVWDDSIAAVAKAHSVDMNRRNYFDHVNPDGIDPFQRMKIGGISFGSAAENLVGAGSAEGMVKAWMNSEGHRKNLLNPEFKKTGIGISENTKYGLLGTQNFTD